MYLEKIEIQGFKSFAEPVALVFNKELTAIVGPNGSGKSNIADAIRWVLGEQSLKLLRGKKSEDVIFAGSDAKGRLGFARVVLHMNNLDHRAAIDYATVVIERSIDRSGESEYLINGAKVRLVDVQILLAKAHVGQKSYSVIGQGTIDSLLTFSAQERKDFFDEATGVRQYQLKKNQALHKLEQTEENLEQAELVLHEIEPRLGTLSRQIRKLERKEDLERQLNEAQTTYYSYLMSGVTRELQTLSGTLSREQKALDMLTHEQREIQKKLDAEDHERGRTEMYSLLQNKLFNAQQEYNTLTKKKIVREGQYDVDLIRSGNTAQVLTQQHLEDLNSRKNTLAITAQELDQEIKKIDAAIRQLKATASETSRALKIVERELSAEATAPNRQSLEDRARLLHQEHDELARHIEALETLDALSAFKSEFKNFALKLKNFFEGLNNTSSTNHEAHWERFSTLNADHQKIIAELNVEELSFGIKQHERSSLDRQIAEIMSEEKKLSREVSGDASVRQQSQSQDIKELNTELEHKEEEMQELRKEIDSFNENEEKKKSSLMDLQKKFRTLQYDFTLKNNSLNEVKIETAKLETKKEDLEKEIAQEAPHCVLKEVNALNDIQARETITTLKKQLAIIGGIDTETVKEYEEVKKKHGFLTQQTTDLRSAEQSLMELIKDLDEHISKQFQQSFKNINIQFAKYFKQLFNGGAAKLLLQMQTEKEASEEENSEGSDRDAEAKKKKKFQTDRFDYSIEIQATPPGKKLANIAMLSGGEKALASIALICSIIANNPPPFVVLDEVDAALDEANSIRFAEIISELIDKSQFITITHNRATMHQAKILYGVSMNKSGVSQLLSVNFAEAEKMSA